MSKEVTEIQPTELETLRAALEKACPDRDYFQASLEETGEVAASRLDDSVKQEQELRTEVERLRKQNEALKNAAEMLWVVLANVSGGDWEKQPLEWQVAAARWRDNYFAALAPNAGSTLPSVAGHMEMTHQHFQRACQAELERIQNDHNCDNALIHLLCEAVRCSRECCDLAKHGFEIPSTLLTREQVQPLVEALQYTSRWCWNENGDDFDGDKIQAALAHARTLGLQ